MLFKQIRIGKNGVPFVIYKFRSISKDSSKPNKWGKFIRLTKLDEIPQIINILKGDMTFVGPRPDVPGYADKLEGLDRIILKLKPGITGLASIKYRNEEQILAKQLNPQKFNDEVIWPDKVKINKWYFYNRCIIMDLQILFYTLIPIRLDVDKFMMKHYKKSCFNSDF